MDDHFLDQDQMAIFEEKMKALSLEYLDSLHGWGRELTDLCKKETGWNEAELKAAIMTLHRIAGSGALYGFEDLGKDARALEISLEEGGLAAVSDMMPKILELAVSCEQARIGD